MNSRVAFFGCEEIIDLERNRAHRYCFECEAPPRREGDFIQMTYLGGIPRKYRLHTCFTSFHTCISVVCMFVSAFESRRDDAHSTVLPELLLLQHVGH